MKNFDYRKAFTLDEALRLIADHKTQCKILAGGTDLLAKMRHKVFSPSLLIDLKGIPDLNRIQYDFSSGLRIGALTSIHQLETSLIVKEKFGILTQAASSLGSYQIRCRATLGGNLCNASPAADMAPALIALGAEVTITGLEGKRNLPLESFFIAPGKTNLNPGEILTEVRVPNPLASTAFHYVKHGIRKAIDLAIVVVAVALSLDSDSKTCSRAVIALGAVNPTPMRASKAENSLYRQKIDAGMISRAALIASEETHPISDIRASIDYRKEMVRTLTDQSLRKVWTAHQEGATCA